MGATSKGTDVTSSGTQFSLLKALDLYWSRSTGGSSATGKHSVSQEHQASRNVHRETSGRRKTASARTTKSADIEQVALARGWMRSCSLVTARRQHRKSLARFRVMKDGNGTGRTGARLSAAAGGVNGSRCHKEKESPDRNTSYIGKGKTHDEKAYQLSVRKTGSNWDVRPDEEDFMLRSVLQQQPLMQPKKRRECYCGNLTVGKVTEELLADALKRLFHSLPAFIMSYPDVDDPVRSVSFPPAGQGMFAFVEFYDEVVANTAIQMSGFELCGRPVKVGRPQGYFPPPNGELLPLDVTPLRMCGLIPPMPDLAPGAKGSPVDRIRELYFGGLQAGAVSESIMMELLTPVCIKLPEYVPELGSPITKVYLAPSGTYCFVQFQSAELASRMIAIFDDTELFGRRMRVSRPTQYQLNSQQVAIADAPTCLQPSVDGTAGQSQAFRAGAAAVAGLQL